MGNTRRVRTVGVTALVGVCAQALWVGLACQPSGGGGGGEQPSGRPLECGTQLAIVNIPTNIPVSTQAGMPLTIIYNADASATNIRGFYVPVSSSASTSTETGPEVLVAENLPAGQAQSFNIPLGQLEEGFYRVGIRAGSGNSEARCLSPGTIEVTQSSLPEFTLPEQNIEVTQGEQVQVAFDLNDPTGQLFWRLFFIDADGPFDVPADEIGTQIRTGQGDSEVILWNTGPVAVGEYLLGLSTTDSGESVAETVAAGDSARVRTILNPFVVTVDQSSSPSTNAPLLEVTQPSFNVNVLVGEADTVNIGFDATIRVLEPVDASIRVFYDQDGEPNTGDEVTIADGLSPDANSATLDTQSLALGVYFIGVTVSDGVNPPVTEYASGRVTVSTEKLEVTAPDLTLPVKPGTEVTVEWETNITFGASVDVFRRALDASGQPTGPEIQILAPTDDSVSSATFVAAESGLFQITVRYKFDNTSKPDLVDSAPTAVRVSSQPFILWVGQLAEFNPVDNREQPRGAVFEGHQFEDNAGTSFAGGTDFDGDGIDDFVVAARYAKPDFVNPTGVGIGEAYLIRGSSTRFREAINLNTTSTSSLPGMVFSGVDAPVTPTESTEGLASMFITPDADGDGVGELLFGIPRNSNFGRVGNRFALPNRDICCIDRDLAFENGGVVFVSSQNDLVAGAGDTQGTRIPLERVGMLFDDEVVHPEPGLGTGPRCNPSWLEPWLFDAWTYFEGECPEPEPCEETPCEPCPENQQEQCCPVTGFVCGPPDNFPCPGICSDGVSQCIADDPAFQCPPIVPLFSFSGCVPNLALGGLLPSTDPDGIRDTLSVRHGFLRYLAYDFLDQYYPSFPGEPLFFPCPSCHARNPDSPMDCHCLPNFIDSGNSWVPGDPDDLCLSTTLEPGNGDPLELQAPNSDAGIPECPQQHQLIRSEIGDPPRRPDVSLSIFYPHFFSGFYPDQTSTGAFNDPRGPFGCRMIGREIDSDHPELSRFGTSITISGGELIISAPGRDAVAQDDVSALLGGTPSNPGAGIGYIFTFVDLWGGGAGVDSGSPLQLPVAVSANIPPKPHMYRAGGGGHTLSAPPGGVASKRETFLDRPGLELALGGIAVAGRSGEHIENILGIPDFNRDIRPDFAVGSPTANSTDGACYVCFRRARSLEGDYVLDKLALDPNNLERLAGVLVNGKAGSDSRFGESLAGDVDFDSNGFADVVIGAPNGNSGTGEVFILFASRQLTSPEGGAAEQTLINQRQAAKIIGIEAGSEFGFNLANVGDIDGDGANDLVIAAPGATPMFDPNPNDATDALTAKGVDRDLNGVKDDVTGPRGVPDGVVDNLDNLEKSGVVYVIYGSTDARKWATSTNGPFTIAISKLGTAQLPGFIVAGRRANDLLAGGDAATTNPNKTFGRSKGLAGVGDVNGDGNADFMVGSILADPRVDPQTGVGTVNAGEAYLIYGFDQN